MTKRIPVIWSVLLALTSIVLVADATSATEVTAVAFSPEAQQSIFANIDKKADKDLVAAESDLPRERIYGGRASVSTNRALWVWNTDILTNTTARREFLIFAQLKNLTSVYLNSYDLLPTHADDLTDFIASSSDVGVRVELLAGDPTWALAPNHPVTLGFVQQAITFTQSISGSVRPTAIHLDVEPYLLPEWDSDRSSTITQYLDLLSDVKQELIGSGASLNFAVDIPFWYDTITATYKSETQPLNQHVQDMADRVVIMDYRDFAEGNDGIIDHAQDEMDYAGSIAKEVVVGVETNDVEPEKVTLFEEGETVMESELALVEQHYQTSPAFRGFAIHDYSGYRALAPIRSVYLSLVLKSNPAD